MGFADPKSLSDSELIEDLEAAKTIYASIENSDHDSLAGKEELDSYVSELYQEYERRKGEEWIYPLSALGILQI